MVFNGRLANRGLASLVKEATGGQLGREQQTVMSANSTGLADASANGTTSIVVDMVRIHEQLYKIVIGQQQTVSKIEGGTNRSGNPLPVAAAPALDMKGPNQVPNWSQCLSTSLQWMDGRQQTPFCDSLPFPELVKTHCSNNITNHHELPGYIWSLPLHSVPCREYGTRWRWCLFSTLY